jgi:uncharacterized repeat protein (TIGR01451 family)
MWRGTLGALAVVATSALIAYAAAPTAGTLIGNQATATYNDGTGTSRTVTSNLVQTVVQQVASLTLTADGAKTAAPGTQVVYPHTLTNTGNGTDGFTLTLTQSAADNFDLSSAAIYADTNQDGVPDNTTNLIGATVSLAPGAAYSFVVSGVLPGTGLSSGNTSQVTVKATSTFLSTTFASNTDTTTVSNQAVLNVTKAININTGASPSGPYTYTLTYTNTGNATATAATLTDVIPTGMTYVANSARWSVTGATVLTDADTVAQGTSPNTIIYDFGVTVAGRITAVVNQVIPGETRTLTFQVNVNSGLAPGLVNNTAQYSYNDGTTVVGPFSTNTVPFTVASTYAVSISDTGLSAADDEDSTANDIVTKNAAAQGSTVVFKNVVKNNGNNSDTFNIAFSGSTFPAGTTFQLFKSDGVSPLLDSNSDSIPDTGPVATGATYTVILKAVLPAAATGGPFNVTVTATSINDNTKTDTVTDRLVAITASSVDLTNNAALPGAPGAGAGPEASAVVTNTTNAGTTTTFTLFVNNTGTTVDTYNLSAGSTSAMAALPAGWTVQFYLDNGDGIRNAGDTLVTNSGSIAGGANARIFADVTIPAGLAAATQDVFFRVLSPTTAASDIIHDAVTISTQRSLTLVPNNTGQVFPGGTVVYQHTLKNNGTVSEGGGGAGSTITISTVDSAAGFTSVLYLDVNNNGVVDAGDTVIDDSISAGGGTFAGPLAPGASVRLLVKVTAPAGAVAGTTDTATVTVTVTGTINSIAPPANAVATDVTSVISGQLTLNKQQAIDANCDGTADTAFGTANINAAPAQCVCYTVTAQNVGTADATSAVIQDPTPSFTKVSKVATVTLGTIDGTSPGVGSTGLISATVGTMTPGQQAVLAFCVKIDN